MTHHSIGVRQCLSETEIPQLMASLDFVSSMLLLQCVTAVRNVAMPDHDHACFDNLEP